MLKGKSREIVNRSQEINSAESVKDPKGQIPVRVVVSQGPKELKPVVLQEQVARRIEEDPSSWRGWFKTWL